MKRIIFLTITILSIFILLSTCALPADEASTAIGTRAASSRTGTHNGFFYVFWSDGRGTVNTTLGPAGNYSVQWTNCGNFLFGKGRNPGSGQAISYSATFRPTGVAYLSLYGWTLNPLIEYYIVDNWGSYRPAQGTRLGSFASDGGVYEIYKKQMFNHISIVGTATYYQYWSVRTSKRASGTITPQNHFTAWSNLGMNLGTMNYQVVSTEGVQGSGTADVTVR